MTPEMVKVLALIAASQARIEGMKATNQICAFGHYRPAYGKQDFFQEAELMQALAQEVAQK
jgi:hypothetical protein